MVDYPTILLADDDINDVFLLKRALRELRLQNPIRDVANAQSVAAYFEGEGIYADREKFPLPGIMFLDMHICCTSALDLIPWLREHVRPESCRIFVWTGSSNEAEIDLAHQFGANSCLRKPLSTREYPSLLQGLPGLHFEPVLDGSVLVPEAWQPTLAS